jgi:hypothetical protein
LRRSELLRPLPGPTLPTRELMRMETMGTWLPEPMLCPAPPPDRPEKAGPEPEPRRPPAPP